jgi:drug/metabolite transporter (DMT)-like permease
MLNSAPFLFVITTFFWGGNVVAGKIAVGDVSPMLLTFLRWFVSCSLLFAISRRDIAAQWPNIKPRLGYVIIMAVFGFTAFNSMYYTAAEYTAGVNLAIIQGSTPVIVLIGAAILGARLRATQVLGIILTLIGVGCVASKGDINNLIGLNFNFGDLLLLLASIFYAGYTLALKKRPPMPTLVFFFYLALASAITSFPGVIYEWASGHFIWPTAKGWLIVLYVGVFPSLICQVCYIRGVEIAGPARASAYYNLVPIFGSFLSIALLGERFYLSDAIALALVIAGIVLAENLLTRKRTV